MRFYTTAKIGKTRELTPEGFLACRDVPIARTGEMVYTPNELGIEAGADGLVHLWRTGADLFRPETIASFEGKPVTLGHPSDLSVTPENYREFASGTVQNVRQQGELLLADLLITAQDAIDAVQGGIDELSCGYDFDYYPTAQGSGRQTNIIGNHVAIVDNARGGSILKIGDSINPKSEVSIMAKLPPWLKAIGHALKAGDEETAAALAEEREKEKEQAGDEDSGGGNPDFEARLKAVEDELSGLRNGGLDSMFAKLNAGNTTGDESADQTESEEKGKANDSDDNDEDDKPMKAGDSGFEIIRHQWQEIQTNQAILAPNCQTKLPALDSVKTVKSANDSMNQVRKASILAAMQTDNGRAAIMPLLGGKALDSISDEGQALIFNAATQIVRHINNGKTIANDSAMPVIMPTMQGLYRNLYQNH